MPVWDVIKDLELDLSGISDENVLKIVKSFDQAELDQLKAELETEIANNQALGEMVKVGLRIAKVIVEKGIELLL